MGRLVETATRTLRLVATSRGQSPSTDLDFTPVLCPLPAVSAHFPQGCGRAATGRQWADGTGQALGDRRGPGGCQRCQGLLRSQGECLPGPQQEDPLRSTRVNLARMHGAASCAIIENQMPRRKAGSWHEAPVGGLLQGSKTGSQSTLSSTHKPQLSPSTAAMPSGP